MSADFAWYGWLLILLASVAAGFVNALAGGGSLIAFPTLVALGVPSVTANIITNMAVVPGHAGATWTQRMNLEGQRQRIYLLAPTAIVGGFAGALLLLVTPEALFEAIVPWLILLAVLALALQQRVRAYIINRSGRGEAHQLGMGWLVPLIFLNAVYGGYFGAGVGIITLALLGIIIDDTLKRLNALKQVLSLVITAASGVVFVFSGQIIWSIAVVMAVGALLGDALGGRFARSVSPALLRNLIVGGGLILVVVFFVT